MIVHFNEPTLMPTYVVAGEPVRQIWAANAAAFEALGIFRERVFFGLTLTTHVEFGLER